MPLIEPHWIMGALGGLMIGGAAALFLLANGRIMGASGLFGDLIAGADRPGRAERAAFLAGLILVPLGLHLWVQPVATGITGNLWLVVAGGLLVGVGTRAAKGCTSGHGVCGVARGSRRSLAATATFLTAGFVTMAVLRHGLGWL